MVIGAKCFRRQPSVFEFISFVALGVWRFVANAKSLQAAGRPYAKKRSKGAGGRLPEDFLALATKRQTPRATKLMNSNTLGWRRKRLAPITTIQSSPPGSFRSLVPNLVCAWTSLWAIPVVSRCTSFRGLHVNSDGVLSGEGADETSRGL